MAPHILELKSYLSNPAPVFSLLILGERGTGKTKGITDLAIDLGKKVVKTNGASFADDTLAESELFGHKKGAFTGAYNDKDGLLNEANKGILFIDEVHTLINGYNRS